MLSLAVSIIILAIGAMFFVKEKKKKYNRDTTFVVVLSIVVMFFVGVLGFGIFGGSIQHEGEGGELTETTTVHELSKDSRVEMDPLLKKVTFTELVDDKMQTVTKEGVNNFYVYGTSEITVVNRHYEYGNLFVPWGLGKDVVEVTVR